jgi:hypothetical protein
MEPRTSHFWNATRDTVLLAALFAGLNYLLDRADPGWLALNPTPWLLLPLLIGARYGIVSGSLVGALGAAALVFILARRDGMSEQSVALAHLYPLTALVLAGFLAGEMHQILAGRRRQLEGDNHRLVTRADLLEAELKLMRDARHDLQNQLALHNAPLACLDLDLRKIALLPAPEVHEALLHLLARAASVTSAAVYQSGGSTLQRLAVLNPVPALAETLRADGSPLVSRALAEQSIAAYSDPARIPQGEPFLCAVPWAWGSSSGLLLIQDMPLDACTWQNFSRIEVMLHWAFKIRDHTAALAPRDAASCRIVPLEEFLMMVAQLLETEQRHCLPSSMLRLDPATAGGSVDIARLRPLIPAGTVATGLPEGGHAVLLPFNSMSEAEALMRSISEKEPAVRATHFLIEGPARAQDVWAQVVGS